MRHTFTGCFIAALLLTASTPMIGLAEDAMTEPAVTQAPATAASSSKVAASANMSNISEAIMLELKVESPELLEKLNANLQEQRAAIATWQTTNKEAYSKALADRRSEDPATKQQGQEAVAKLTKDRIAIQDSFGAKAIALLTPELQLAWEAAKLARTEQGSLARTQVKLTEDQLASVKSLAASLLKDVDLSKTADLKKAAAALRAQVAQSILTPEQAAQRAAAIAEKTTAKPTPEAVKPKPAAKPVEKPAEQPAETNTDDM